MAVRLLDVKVPDPSVVWEYFAGFSVEQSRVNVYIRNQRGARGYLGDVVLVTDSAAQPEIRVPVFVDPTMRVAKISTDWPSLVAAKQGCGCGARF